MVSRVEAVLKVIIMLLRYFSVEDSQEGCAEAGSSEYLGQTSKSCYYKESHGYINCYGPHQYSLRYSTMLLCHVLTLALKSAAHNLAHNSFQLPLYLHLN